MSADAFADALRRSMTAHGLSLRELSTRLADRGAPLSPAALSFWRSGRRQPEGATSLDAVERLEEIFGLPAGELTALVGPSRRRPRPTPLSPDALMHPDITRGLFEQLGYDFTDLGLVEVSVSNTVDVRSQQIETITTRTIFRATSDRVERFPLYLESDRPRPEPFTHRVVHGCRIGRTARDASGLVQIFECILDEPLGVGQTAAVEVEVTDLQTAADEDHFYEIHARRRIRDLVVWVRFHEGPAPSRAVAYRGGDEPPTELSIHNHSVHSEASSYGPGKFGIRWEW